MLWIITRMIMSQAGTFSRLVQEPRLCFPPDGARTPARPGLLVQVLYVRVTDGSRPLIDQSADLISLLFLPSCRIDPIFRGSLFLPFMVRSGISKPFFFLLSPGTLQLGEVAPSSRNYVAVTVAPWSPGCPAPLRRAGAWPRSGCCALIGGARERKSRKTGEGGARCNGTKVGTFAASRKLCPGSFWNRPPPPVWACWKNGCWHPFLAHFSHRAVEA